jgi:hypothetical protein
MTLFLEIIRELLIKNIEIIKARIEKDDSSSFSMLRDKSLSEFKKRQASNLLEIAYQLKECESDLSCKDIIIREILKVQTAANNESRKYGYEVGKFNQEMCDLITLLETVYQKLSDANLLNIVRNNTDAFSIFCFQAGSYLAHKAEQSLNVSYLGYLSSHPKLSTRWELGLKKEKLIADKIKACKEALDVLNTEHAKYQEHYSARVTDFIDEVIRENEGFCAEHSTGIGIPLVSFGFLSILSARSSFQPKAGMLNFHMIKAKEDILRPSREHELTEEVGLGSSLKK